MALGKDTFSLNKGEYSAKLGKIIANHRPNSSIIGEPREFILRSCRLTEQWLKLSGDPEVKVRVRNISLAGGRSVKMLSLERGTTRQPISKSKLVECLYPTKRIATSATPEVAHYNKIKGAMRAGIDSQIKDYRRTVNYPTLCRITGKKLIKGSRTDVDHFGLSFSEIADSFIALKNKKYTDIVLVGPPNAKRFKDKLLWEEWLRYHEEKAHYAIVCSTANRSKGCGDYSTHPDLYGSFKSEDPEEVDLEF